MKSIDIDSAGMGDRLPKAPYVRIPRIVLLSILKRGSFSSNMFRVFGYMLQGANFVDGVTHVKGGVYSCKMGELVVSRSQIGEFLQLDRSTVSTCINELKNRGLIEFRPVGRQTCFTVCNYAQLVGAATGRRAGDPDSSPHTSLNPYVSEREERCEDEC